MKQAVSRKKAVSPLPRKSYDQSKAAKKTVAVVAVKSVKPLTAKSVKLVAAKNAPVAVARKATPKAVIQKQKTDNKALKAANLNKKSRVGLNETKQTAVKPPVKQSAKNIAVKSADKLLKTKLNGAAQKKTSAKNSAAAAKSKVAARTAKSETPKASVKISAVKPSKPTAQAKLETPKTALLKQKIPAAKNSQPQAVKKIAAPSKIAAKNTKIKTALPAAKAENDMARKKPKASPVVSVEKKSRKSLKTATPIVAEKAVRAPKKVQAAVVPKSLSPKAKKIQASIAPTIAKPITEKNNAKKVKVVAPEPNVPIKKVKLAAPPVEAVELPIPKPKKKKVKPIGAAIFRGVKTRYDFQVFPVDGEFEDAAAIFVISRRKIDKNKRAHHKMVCIGQTASVLEELKKHRKGKCFKQHQANVISVLREENEQKRLKIVSDLMSAHTIPCPHA